MEKIVARDLEASSDSIHCYSKRMERSLRVEIVRLQQVHVAVIPLLNQLEAYDTLHLKGKVAVRELV